MANTNTKSLLKDKIANILPKRDDTIGMGLTPNAMSSLAIDKRAETIADKAKQKQSAKELAQLKYREHARMQRAEANNRQKEAEEAEERLNTLEVISEIKTDEQKSSLDVAELAKVTPASEYPQMVKKALQLQGASRPEIVKLLNSLNINLSVQLTKQDTANLLACLLTCNESQLQALLKNPKVPVVIKTVIKRMMEDMKLGNIDTVERLWDRIFGKGAMQLNLPEQTQTQTGILPNTPLSREAYIIIRETLIGQ